MKITITGDSFEDVKRQMLEIVGDEAETEPETVAPPVAQAQPEVTAPPIAQAQPEVTAPPIAQAQPEVTAPPVAQAQPQGPHKLYGVDADGVVWDERIHASTKTKTQDGRWKKKRGVHANLVAQVMAELQGQQPVAANAAPPVAQAQPAAAAQVVTVEQLSMRFGELITQGKIDMAGMQQIMMETVGFSNINQLQPHQIAQVSAVLEARA